ALFEREELLAGTLTRRDVRHTDNETMTTAGRHHVAVLRWPGHYVHDARARFDVDHRCNRLTVATRRRQVRHRHGIRPPRIGERHQLVGTQTLNRIVEAIAGLEGKLARVVIMTLA